MGDRMVGGETGDQEAVLLAGTRRLRNRWDRKLSCQSSNPKLNTCIPTVWEHSQRSPPSPSSFSFFLGWALWEKFGLDCGACLWAQDPRLSCPSCVPEPLKYKPAWRKEGAGLDWNKSLALGVSGRAPRGKRGGGWDGIMCGLGGDREFTDIYCAPSSVLTVICQPGSSGTPHPVSDIGQALRRYKQMLLRMDPPGCLLSRVCQINVSFFNRAHREDLREGRCITMVFHVRPTWWGLFLGQGQISHLWERYHSWQERYRGWPTYGKDVAGWQAC